MLKDTAGSVTPPATCRSPRIFRLHLVAHFVLLAAAMDSRVLATHFTYRFEQLAFMDHYRYQANGFWAGQLDFHNDSGAPLGPLTDSENYKGKTYFAYGPLPAVFQLALNNWLRLNVPSSSIVWILTAATLYCTYWLTIGFVTHVHGVRESLAIFLAAGLCLGIGTTYQFVHMSLVPFAWSQADVAGQLCVVLAVWAVLTYYRQRQDWFAALAGLAAGCGFLCKQNYILATLPVAAFLLVERPAGSRLAGRLKRPGAWFAAPVVCCVTVLMLWNYLRFGSPFETGNRFVNTMDPSPPYWTGPQLHRIPFNFYNHFLAGVQIRFDDFPFLRGLSRQFGAMNLSDGSGGLLHDFKMFSAFLSIPLLAVLPLYSLRVGWTYLRRHQLGLADRWWCFLVAVAASSFVLYLTLDSSWIRYQYDFLYCSALAVLGALLSGGALLRDRLRTRPRMAATAAGGVLLCVAFLWQAAVGIDQSLGVLFAASDPNIYRAAFEWPSDGALQAKAQKLRMQWFGASR
jgi:hypothetical protein